MPRHFSKGEQVRDLLLIRDWLQLFLDHVYSPILKWENCLYAMLE